MGRPFVSELLELPITYSESLLLDIEPLSNIISKTISSNILAIGSGGSLSAAHFLTEMHQRYACKLSKTVTPLEVSEMGSVVRDTSTFFISASGRNKDILSSYEITGLNEPSHLISLCAKQDAPLTRLSRRFQFSTAYEFSLGSRKDGFLATNSLVAFYTLIARAYMHIFDTNARLPDANNLWSGIYSSEYLDIFSRSLWDRKTIIVLYEPRLHSVAIDLESKFTEAALGNIQLADFRNFGHGRHHWLAKHGEDSGVIALFTEEHEDLAIKTLDLIPSSIPKLPLSFQGGESAIIQGLISIFNLAYCAGKVRGIDPGRPGVPDFGSKLYHLSGNYKKTKLKLENNPSKIALIRKSRNLSLYSLKHKNKIYDSYEKFLKRLTTTPIRAIIFDYDGTLSSHNERFGDLRDDVRDRLLRLLESGVYLGIATGRGKSIRQVLRKAIPETYWDNIVVGYYNGADCGLLSDVNSPDVNQEANSSISNFANLLENNTYLKDIAKFTIRPYQITIEPNDYSLMDEIWLILQSNTFELSGLKIVRSTHSLDILASHVSKLDVLNYINLKKGIPLDQMLCVGDQGLWPGNDYELLSQILGLSVDSVSPNLDTCWNLAPAGYKGIDAALYYLDTLNLRNSTDLWPHALYRPRNVR